MATGVEDEKKALTYVDDWNIRTLSEFLGQNGPRPTVRKFVPAAGNSWLERVNFVLADSTMATADAHWLEGLEASGIGAGNENFTPEQLAALLDGKELTTTDWRALAGDELGVSRTAFYRIKNEAESRKLITRSKVSDRWMTL